jgi:beta-lactamase regulating signal transducer with metallopeptidase domain
MDAIFLQVLNMSLTASYVILFVLAARLLLKRAPKIFSYALWSVVLFRLICPFSFESLLSLLLINANPIPGDIMYAEVPQINTGISLVDRAVNPVLSTQTAMQGASVNPMQIWVFAGRTIWLAGMALLLIYSFITLLRLRADLVGAVKWRDNIYLADHLRSPFVMGVMRPKIYLPSTLSEQEQRYILLHEQTHIRRFDHVIKIIAFFALAAHWFNPLVWLAFILYVKDMEMSCDESVMKHMDTDIRKEYSASLLSFAAGRKIMAGMPLAFGESDTKSRIKNVLDYKKPGFWVIIAALVVVLALCAGLASDPRNNNKPQDSIASLLKHRTEYVGDNSKVGGIINALEYPDKVKYKSFELHTGNPPLSVTINFDTDTETRNFYTGALNEGPFRKNAIIMFSLIHNAEYITFVLDDGTNPYLIQYTRDDADMFAEGDIWSYSSSPEQFETLMEMIGSIAVTEPEPWNPQTEIEAAQQSVNNEEITVDDKGSNEKTALAWMEAWFDMYKALPKDNMAYITEGAVDRLKITKVSKEGQPKAFVFSVTCSVRPTYPIGRNAFWMAGNTGNSPGRDETWGQMYREVELRLEDDGKYHFVEMGTGGVGHSKDYDTVID